MDRSCGVENVAVVGWVCSFATFVDDSLKRVVFGLCGLRDDPDAKQQRKLVTGIVTFRTTTNLLNTSIYFTYMLTNFIFLYLKLCELTFLMMSFLSRWYITPYTKMILELCH